MRNDNWVAQRIFLYVVEKSWSYSIVGESITGPGLPADVNLRLALDASELSTQV